MSSESEELESFDPLAWEDIATKPVEKRKRQDDGSDDIIKKFANATGEIVGFESSENTSDSSTSEDDSDEEDGALSNKIIMLTDEMFKKEKERQAKLLKKQKEGRMHAAIKPSQLPEKAIRAIKERARLCKVKPSKPTMSFTHQGKQIEFYEQVSMWGYTYAVGDKVMICKDPEEVPVDHTKEVESIFLQYKVGDNEDDEPRIVDMLSYINYFDFGEIEQIFKNIQGMILIEYKRYVHAMVVNTSTDPSLERQLYITTDTVKTDVGAIMGPIQIIHLSMIETPMELIPQFAEQDEDADIDNYTPPEFVCLEGCKVEQNGKKAIYTIVPAIKIIEDGIYASGCGLQDYLFYSGKRKYYEHPYFNKEVRPIVRHLIRYGQTCFRSIDQSKLFFNSMLCTMIEMEETERAANLMCSCVLCGKSLHLTTTVAKIVWKYKKPRTKQEPKASGPSYLMPEFVKRYGGNLSAEDEADGPYKVINGYVGTDCMRRIECAMLILKSCRDMMGFLSLTPEVYKKRFLNTTEYRDRFFSHLENEAYIDMDMMHAALSQCHRKLLDDAMYM